MIASRRIVAMASLLAWVGWVGCGGSCASCDRRSGDVGEILARCVKAEGDVRYHTVDALIWNPLEVNQSLGAGYWVRTAAEASAVLELVRGGELKVGPGSTVVIEALDPEADDPDALGQISVVRGTVRAAVPSGRAQRAVVVSDRRGKRMRVASAEGTASLAYEIRAEREGEVGVSITEGRAEIRAPDGREIALSAGESSVLLRIDEGVGAPPGEKEPPPSLAAPALASGRDAEITIGERRTLGAPLAGSGDAPPGIDLEWRAVEGAEGYVVEVASDSAFALRVAKETLPANVTRWRFVPTEPGERFWRVVALGSRPGVEAASEMGRIVVHQRDDLLAPRDGAVVQFGSKAPTLTFTWRASALPVDGYELVVARTSDLTDVALRIPTSTTEARTSALGVGNYSWAVFAVRASGREPLQPRPRRLDLRSDRVRIRAPKGLTWK